MDAMDLDIVPTAPHYHPLDPHEIRLALLEPSPDDDGPLSVRLYPASIQSPPPYDAISYVWGHDTTDTVPILCDGMPVRITKNLHWALMRARKHRRTTTMATANPGPTSVAIVVWADALCINQRDNAERSAQVALMGRIYAGARTVLVCMGPNLSDGGGAHVASLLHDWEKARVLCATGREDEVDPNVFQDKQRWRALGALTGAPWFERVWVVQEVGLARDPRVLYGGGEYGLGGGGGDGTVGVAPGAAAEFSYRLMRQSIAWTCQRMLDFATSMGIRGLAIHHWWSDWSQLRVAVGVAQQPRHYQFLDLLDHGALLQCRDPRDRIYAFLGHPLAAAAGPIVPDYTKPKLRVFQETTVLLLRDSGVRTLSSVEHDVQTIEEDAPSWVVRWDVTPTLNNVWSSDSQLERAGAGISTGQSLELDGDYLQVGGVVVDSISSVFPVRLVPNQLQILFTSASANHWQDLVDFVSELEHDRATPFAYDAASKGAILAHTLCGQYLEIDLMRLYSEYISNQQRRSDGIAQIARLFYCRVESLCLGRAFVITSKGYYGLAPGICCPGDVCAVVQDGAVPLLLRPQSSDSGGGDGSAMSRRLVGEMYLHGFMEGHAASMVREGMLGQEVFRIR
ncbi:hypothetical protein PG999_010885 [Apiospora kogelbergensis]|uniref:Heterokaryon incompatibility domain-containing protein n=1 Tax=Apiospora kogelbergensis TaxID=1337665 RepID=A0AAW0QFL1_9PEZI